MKISFLPRSSFYRYIIVGGIAYLIYTSGVLGIIYWLRIAWLAPWMMAGLYLFVTLLAYAGQFLITFSSKASRGFIVSFARYLALSLLGSIILGAFAGLLSASSDFVRLSGQLIVTAGWNICTYMVSKRLIF